MSNPEQQSNEHLTRAMTAQSALWESGGGRWVMEYQGYKAEVYRGVKSDIAPNHRWNLRISGFIPEEHGMGTVRETFVQMRYIRSAQAAKRHATMLVAAQTGRIGRLRHSGYESEFMEADCFAVRWGNGLSE